MKKKTSVHEESKGVFLSILGYDAEGSIDLLRTKLEKELDCSIGEVIEGPYSIVIPFYFDDREYRLVWDDWLGSYIWAEPNNRSGLEGLKDKLEQIIPERT